MSSSPSFCGICDIRHISNPSDVWCPDCDEGLCTECLDHHSLVKSSRKHTTIPIAEYQKLPSYVLEIKPEVSFVSSQYFGWIDNFTDILLVPEGAISPVVIPSVPTWLIRYTIFIIELYYSYIIIYMLIQSIYYRISTPCQVLHLSVVYVISAIFLSHQTFGVQIVMKDFAQNA
jgi:hypothetical protein